MANAMLAALQSVGMKVDTFGDSTGPLNLNTVAS